MKLAGSFAAAFRIGLASARANLLPMIVLWTLAGALVGAYYLLVPFRGMLEPMADWPRLFFRRMVMPNLIPNWIVWIPVSLAVFSFPFPLQIHVNGIVCTFWTLMCLQIGRHT